MRFFARLALATAFLAAGSSFAAAWSFGNVYQEKANRFCTSTSECARAFPEVPAGKVMRVTHLSCALTAAEERQSRQFYVRLTNKATGETMAFQQPFTLKARVDGQNWWIVDGTVDFFIPANTTIEFVYTGTGTLVTRVDCALAGLLSKAS